MPLTALGDEDECAEAQATDSVGEEVADCYACCSPWPAQQQGTARGEEANCNRNRQKWFAFVRSQIDCLAENEMIAHNGDQQQAEDGQ